MEIHELNTFSGTPGAGDFLATDNGTDTSKIAITDITDPLNTRIDNIIAGPASSAQEVIDARLGADGVLYSSLGDAIRGQAGELIVGLNNSIQSRENVLALEVEPLSYSMLANKVISSDGNISTVTGADYKVTDYIPVEYGQFVSFAFSRARYGNQNWAFYDANKSVVETYGKTASGVTVERNQKIRVPYRAKFFVLSRDTPDSSNEPDSNVNVITKYCESIDYKPSSVSCKFDSTIMSEEDYTPTNYDGKFISHDQQVLNFASDTSFKVTEVSVSDGDVINIYDCVSMYSNIDYLFVDASGLPIYGRERGSAVSGEYLMLRVPFGASKLYVSGKDNYAVVKKVVSLMLNQDVVPKWSSLKWACMGDSITDANNARATKRYFNYIQDYSGINVVNLGVSGTGYMKPYNGELPFYQRVDTIPLDSDVITIFGSGNDCALTLGTPTDSGTTTVCGCINATIDGIRARIVGANIGIIAPTPWDDYPTYTENNMSRYVDALEQICNLKGVPFLNLYRCSNMLPWEQSFREAFYTRDDGNGVHPDENGHKFFAPHIKAFLETLLM